MMPLDENPKYVDNGIRCNPINQWKVDTWQVREPNLDSSFLPNGLGGKITERKGKREKGRDSRKRGFNFSLNFMAIGPSNPSEPRSKVAPYDKSYAWTPVLWSFKKLQKIGVFSYSIYFQFKSH